MLDVCHTRLPDKPKAPLRTVFFKLAGNKSAWSVFETPICFKQVIFFTPQRDNYELPVEQISALGGMSWGSFLQQKLSFKRMTSSVKSLSRV